MQRVLTALGLLLFLGLLTVGSVGAISAASPQATVTMVFQVNVTVPVVNKAVLGTFTMNFDPATERGTWSFQGTVGGQFATASGSGLYQVNSTATPDITATITVIDAWQMPGIPQPSLPASATIHTIGNLTYVSYNSVANLPLAVSPPLTMPLQSGAYTVTAAGSGAQSLPNLPNTGVQRTGGTDHPIPPVGPLAIALVALLACLGTRARVVARGRRAVTTTTPVS